MHKMILVEHLRMIGHKKIMEYLAAGLPVVSTSLPEVQPFAPDVLLADDAEEFAAACRRAIDGVNCMTRRERSASVADQSWEAVAEKVSCLVAEAIGERHPSTQIPAEPLPVV